MSLGPNPLQRKAEPTRSAWPNLLDESRSPPVAFKTKKWHQQGHWPVWPNHGLPISKRDISSIQSSIFDPFVPTDSWRRNLQSYWHRSVVQVKDIFHFRTINFKKVKDVVQIRANNLQIATSTQSRFRSSIRLRLQIFNNQIYTTDRSNHFNFGNFFKTKNDENCLQHLRWLAKWKRKAI